MAYVSTAKIKKIVACSFVDIFFILVYEQIWQGGVFKFMKNDHLLVFLDIWVGFSRFLGRLRGDLC